MAPEENEFETHKQDLEGTGNPDPNSDLKRDKDRDPRGNISGERTADGTLSEAADELSATEYVKDLDVERKKPDDEAENSESID